MLWPDDGPKGQPEPASDAEEIMGQDPELEGLTEILPPEPGPDAAPEQWVQYYRDECKTVHLYRREGVGRAKKYVYVTVYDDPSVFGLELIQQEHGGGEYQARLVDQANTYLVQPTFAISGTPKGGAGVESMTPEMKKVMDTLDELRAQRSESGSGMSAEFMGVAVQLSAAMNAAVTPLIQALTQREPAQTGPTVGELMELVKTGIDMARDAGGGENSYMDVVKATLPPILGAIRNPPDHLMPSGAPGVAPPGPPAPEVEVLHPEPGRPAWVTVLHPHVSDLLRLAQFHGDPVHWSGQILDRIEGEGVLFIEDALEDPSFSEEFYRYFPDFIPHRQWCSRLFDELADLIASLRAEEDEGSPEDDAGAAGE